MERKIIEQLRRRNACLEGIVYAETFETWEDFWAKNDRGDWMLWVLGKLAGPPGSDSRRPLVMAACGCARLALRKVPAGELRPLKAIETAEAWAIGAEGVTVEGVRSAASAAYAAADAAAYAADAAAYAASAASAADAAASAAHAAASAASAADAASAAARRQALADCADIVRKHYPAAPDLKG